MKTLVTIILVSMTIVPACQARGQDTDPVNKAAKEIRSLLSKYDGDDSVVRVELNELRGALNTYDSRRPDVYVTSRVGDLAAALKAKQAGYALSTLTAIDGLITALNAVRAIDAIGHANALATALREHVNAELPLKSGELRPSEFAALLTALEGAEAYYVFVAIDRRAPILKALLERKAVKEKLPLRNLPNLIALDDEIRKVETARAPVALAIRMATNLATLLDTVKTQQDNPSLKASLEALRSKLAAPPIARFHVIKATYGDIRESMISKKERTCDALPAMIEKCEKKETCRLPASPETALCGYDPVPHTGSRHKGLYLKYACVIGNKARWDRLQRYRSEAVQSEVAHLRATTQVLTCSRGETK